MRHTITTLALAGVMAGGTLAGAVGLGPGAATGTGATPAQAELQAAEPHKATHAVRGVVTSVAGQSLAIRQSGSHPHTFVFVLNPSTLQDGHLIVGATVSVRYYIEGHALVATAVTVNHDARSGP